MRRTFTLSQLILVVAGVSVGASLATRIDWGPRGGCRFTRIPETATQIDLFKLRRGRLPTSLRELVVAGYAKEIPKDAWGRTLIYFTDPSLRDGYRVGSYGADGRAGGEGEAEDDFE